MNEPGACMAMAGPRELCTCTGYERRTVVPKKLGEELDAAIDAAEESCTCSHSRVMHLTMEG